MTDKEFRRLSRGQLVDIIFELQKQLAQAQQELTEAQQQMEKVQAKLAARETNMKDAGSIAQATLGIHEVFTRAQAAADLYLAEVARLRENANAEAEDIRAQAREEARQMILRAQAERMQGREEA